MDEAEAMQERFQLLPAGEYDAVIEKSEDKVLRKQQRCQ